MVSCSDRGPTGPSSGAFTPAACTGDISSLRGQATALFGPNSQDGIAVRAAGARHLRDLEEARQRELFWDKAAASRAIQFFGDILCLAEGEHAGQSFVLQPWQQFIVGSLFGWRGADGGLSRCPRVI